MGRRIRFLGDCFGPQRPGRRELLRLDSKLICQVQRPTSECGVHIRYLMQVAPTLEPEWTSRDVLQHLVLPATASWRCRYVDTIDHEFVGTATYFVAENMQSQFSVLIESLRRRFYRPDGEETEEVEDCYLWFDIFAVNHHMLGNKEEYEQLMQVMLGCRATLVVLDGQCRVLSRLYTLYAIWTTLQAKRENDGQAPQLEILPYCADARYLRNEMLHIDIRTAAALRDYDKNFVMHVLMSKGVLRVNRLVRQAIADGAVLAAERVLRPFSDGTNMADGDPVHAAHALHVCAQMVQLHGRYSHALKLYKQAVDVLMDHLGEVPVSALQLVIHYCELLLLMKSWATAREMAELALDLARQKEAACQQGGMRHAFGRHSISDSAREDMEVGELYSHEAYTKDTSAGAAAAQVPAPLGLQTLPSVAAEILLARALMGLDVVDKAESLVRSAIVSQLEHMSVLRAGGPSRWATSKKKLRRKLELSGSADSGRTMTALADILRLKESASEALPVYFKAIQAMSKALGPNHADVAYVKMRIAQLLYSQRKYDQAEATLREVLEVYRVSWGEEHPETASAMILLTGVELAMLSNKEYDYTDAEHQSALQKATRQYMAAFEVRKAALGPQHQDTLYTLAGATVQLINSSTTRMQLLRAEAMCRLAVKCSVSRQAGGFFAANDRGSNQEQSEKARKQMMALVSNLHLLGCVLVCAGKTEEASMIFNEGHAVAEGELPPRHQLTAHCLLGQADVLHIKKDHKAALTSYRAAVGIFQHLLDLQQPIKPANEGGRGRFLAGAVNTLARLSLSVAPALGGRVSLSGGHPSAAPHLRDHDRASGIGRPSLPGFVRLGGAGSQQDISRTTWAAPWRNSMKQHAGGAHTAVNGGAGADTASAAAGGGASGEQEHSQDLPTVGRQSLELVPTATQHQGSTAVSGANAGLGSVGAAGPVHHPPSPRWGRIMTTNRAAPGTDGAQGGGPADPAVLDAAAAAVEGDSVRSGRMVPPSPNSLAAAGGSVRRSMSLGTDRRGATATALRNLADAFGVDVGAPPQEAAVVVGSPGARPSIDDSSERLLFQGKSSNEDLQQHAQQLLASGGGAAEGQQGSDGTTGGSHRALHHALNSSSGSGGVMGTGWQQRQRRRPVGMLPNIASMQNVLAEDEREGQEDESATHLVLRPVSSLQTAQADSSERLPAVGDSGSNNVTTGPARACAGQQEASGSAAEGGSHTALKPVAVETVVLKAGAVVSTVALTMSEATRALKRQLTGGSASEKDAGARGALEAREQAPGQAAAAGESAQGPGAAGGLQVPAVKTARATSSQPHQTQVQQQHLNQVPGALSDPEDDRRLSSRHPLGSGERSSLTMTMGRERPSKERSSAVARFMRSASQRVAAALMPGGRGGGESEDAEARKQQLKESAVQAARLGDTLVGPHQVILQMGRRAHSGDRPLEYLKQEAASAMSNMALLLRSLGDIREAEAILRQALDLLAPIRHHPQQQRQSQPGAAAGPVQRASLELASPYESKTGGGTWHPAGHRASSPGAAAPPPAAVVEGGSGDPHSRKGGAGASSLPEDPRLLHLRALVMSNLAGLMAADGWVEEAQELYARALQLCASIHRHADAMLIALNLITLLRSQGLIDQAQELASIAVAPYLGITLDTGGGAGGSRPRKGPGYRGGSQAARAHMSAQAMAAAAGLPVSAAHDAPQELRQQLLEALASQVEDDGAHLLYQWAAEELARPTGHQQQHQQQQAPSFYSPSSSTPLRLPESLFLLQVPGIHLQCIHMVRLLVLVNPGEGLSSGLTRLTSLRRAGPTAAALDPGPAGGAGPGYPAPQGAPLPPSLGSTASRLQGLGTASMRWRNYQMSQQQQTQQQESRRQVPLQDLVKSTQAAMADLRAAYRPTGGPRHGIGRTSVVNVDGVTEFSGGP